MDYLDVAVRRAVVTGVNQTCCKVQTELADEVGCDLVEVSAHPGARPEHAIWQGKIFSRSGNDPKYPHFATATGYGTGSGLGGWNCRHTFGPYIEGSPRVYSDKDLAEMDAPKYDVDGRKLTQYEAEQEQRANEREIRKWKRKYAALEAAGQDTEETAAKLKAAEARQKDFLQKTVLKRQYEREQPIVLTNGKTTGKISTEMYKKHSDERSSFSFISDQRFGELTMEARLKGALIIKGTPEVEAHLDLVGASASTIGDTLLFRNDVCISEVLEEIGRAHV